MAASLRRVRLGGTVPAARVAPSRKMAGQSCARRRAFDYRLRGRLQYGDTGFGIDMRGGDVLMAEVPRQRRMIVASEDTSIQNLLAESLDMLFHSRQMPTIAQNPTSR